MKHIMIDIETLGTKPGSVILSISAVGFNLETGDLGSLFHQNISAESCVKVGLEINHETFFWWLNQSKEAQTFITREKGNEVKNVLRLFGNFIHDYFPKDVKVWGNSARFDLGLLEAAYDKCNLRLPWNHYNEMDVRTLVAFKPEVKANQIKFEGTKHYGIDDCKHQIKYCCKIWKTLNNKL